MTTRHIVLAPFENNFFQHSISISKLQLPRRRRSINLKSHENNDSAATMKSEQYLNLCLEQASKSPLHYRHGSIVVRGGKVIGHGFNDFRPGFDGGALKTGRTATGTKIKPKNSGGGGTGSGAAANAPLTCHSEMAAIHSALTACRASSSRGLACERPAFKLPGGPKRAQGLRNEALLAYVKRACTEGNIGATEASKFKYRSSTSEAAAGATESSVQAWCFEQASFGRNFLEREEEESSERERQSQRQSQQQVWNQSAHAAVCV
jgi:deoxycytidylate deaminase